MVAELDHKDERRGRRSALAPLKQPEQIMADDWNRFVRVIRNDGSERNLPLAAWSDDLAQRVLESGGSFVLPEERRRATPPPAKPKTQRGEDLALVRELLNADRGLTAWEVEFVDSLSRWLDGQDTLTEKQRAKAEQIAEELGERGRR